ncbi:MAG: zf-TFIIB domain-containing protein [bacterium]|nr:zf-TFIIB domain-containing protein [bacterium]
MKLVACPDCHAQYDVSSMVPDSDFDCRCGTALVATPPVGVDAPVQRCSSCGAVAIEGADFCAYCGSGIVPVDHVGSLICPECMARNVDDARFCLACGVAFAPSTHESQVSELQCPCCETLMFVREVAGLLVQECAKCRGLWAETDVFESLVQRATTAAIERNAQGGGDGPRLEGGNPFEGVDPFNARIDYRRCPSCDSMMARRNYQKRSGVIVDQCRTHGTWLDADELERIAGFILSGRAADAARIEVQLKEEERRRAARSAMHVASQVRVEAGESLFSTNRSDKSTAESVLGFLISLLD